MKNFYEVDIKGYIEKLPILKTNIISNTIANKLCEAFPEHNFDKKILFTNLSRLNMYIANMPYTSSMAKYFSHNQSIYFNQDLNLEDLNNIQLLCLKLHVQLRHLFLGII